MVKVELRRNHYDLRRILATIPVVRLFDGEFLDNQYFTFRRLAFHWTYRAHYSFSALDAFLVGLTRIWVVHNIALCASVHVRPLVARYIYFFDVPEG